MLAAAVAAAAVVVALLLALMVTWLAVLSADTFRRAEFEAEAQLVFSASTKEAAFIARRPLRGNFQIGPMDWDTFNPLDQPK